MSNVSRRPHWFLRNRITGEVRKFLTYDVENAMWEVVLAGGQDPLDRYAEPELKAQTVKKKAGRRAGR